MLSWDRPKALVHSSISRVCHSLVVSNGWGHWKRKHQCSVCIRARFGAQRLVAFSLLEFDLKAGMLNSYGIFKSLTSPRKWTQKVSVKLTLKKCQGQISTIFCNNCFEKWRNERYRFKLHFFNVQENFWLFLHIF